LNLPEEAACPNGYAPTPALSPKTDHSELRKTKKNVVLVLLDDQDELISPYWEAMPFSKNLFLEQGTRYTKAYASSSVCCASRCQLLTGLYGHNVGVLANAGVYGGMEAFKRPHDANGNRLKDSQGRCLDFESRSLPVFLKQAGYKTAIFGKYINGVENDTLHTLNYAPSPGWDEFVVGTNHAYYVGYNYVLSNWNSETQNLTYDYHGVKPADYFTDVLRDKSLNFIDRARDDGYKDPLFMYVAVSAPHFPIMAAPRHKSHNKYWAAQFHDVVATRHNYNASVQDKASWLRSQSDLRGSLLKTHWHKVDFVKRMGSLYAVDELIQSFYQKFQSLGEAENTVFILASDNGYHLGAHKLHHKMTPYEESVRVPLYFGGGGVSKSAAVDDLTLLIDLVPTILDFAGLEAPSYLNGRSLWNDLMIKPGTSPKRQEILFQYKRLLPGEDPSGIQTETIGDFVEFLPANFALDIPANLAILSGNYKLIKWITLEKNGTHGAEYELYDVTTDPYELTNIAKKVSPALLNELITKLGEFEKCKGQDCLSFPQTAHHMEDSAASIDPNNYVAV
jgi:arylsulfatase A-like enzyme